MLCVIASISIKPGCKEDFIDIFKANVPEVLKETGCIEYTPMVDLPTGWPIQGTDENTVTILEKWESLGALRDHFTTPHMVAYKDKTKDLVISVSAKILTEA